MLRSDKVSAFMSTETNRLSTVWVKKIPFAVFWQFFPNGWEFLINFFTHLLYVSIYARLQIFIHLHVSPTLTKLCHTKRDHPSNFLHFIRIELLSLPTEQMTSLLTSCRIQHVCWPYKSSRSRMTCHRQWSTKLSTTFANIWTCAFRPLLDILSILCELGSHA